MSQKFNPSDPVSLIADDYYDAGEMGCGELILKLKLRMLKLAPQQILHLIAEDPGAIADLPAWCRMTGHQLLHAQHPNYWISRRTN